MRARLSLSLSASQSVTTATMFGPDMQVVNRRTYPKQKSQQKQQQGRQTFQTFHSRAINRSKCDALPNALHLQQPKRIDAGIVHVCVCMYCHASMVASKLTHTCIFTYIHICLVEMNLQITALRCVHICELADRRRDDGVYTYIYMN